MKPVKNTPDWPAVNIVAQRYKAESGIASLIAVETFDLTFVKLAKKKNRN